MEDPVTLADFRAVQDKMHDELKKSYANVKKLAGKPTTKVYEAFYTRVLKYDNAFRANQEKMLDKKLSDFFKKLEFSRRTLNQARMWP